MRAPLHTSQARKRSIAAATIAALALISSILVAAPAQALGDTGTGGVFVPATGRILDTKVGTGGYSTPMEAGKYRTIKVAGLTGVPDDGTVGAVSLNTTVGQAPSAGILFGRPDSNTARTTMSIYNGNDGEYASNTSVVAVAPDGTIQIMTETVARVVLDVQGYYTVNTDGTAAGGFVPMAGKRFVDTRSGLGAPKATIAPSKSIDVQVTGASGVPAGASGAVVNLIAINTTNSDGNLSPYATGGTKPQNSLHYTPSTTTSVQAQVALSSDGKMTIANSSSTIDLVIDLQGYFTAAGQGGASFTPGIGRAYDSRATGNTAIGKNVTRSIQVAGVAGVPVMGSGITAVVATLTVAHGGSDGRATVWADGTNKPDTTAINFTTNEIRTNTVTVPLGANGKIALNNVAEATNYVIDVQGWYTNPKTPTIACAAPFSAGSWVTDTQSISSGVQCSFTAQAATASGQSLAISVNGLPEASFPLSETGPATYSYTFADLIGLTTISAYVEGGGAATPTAQYQFGVGQWDTESLVPSFADGAVTDDNVVLKPVLSSSVLLPADSQVRYDVIDETNGATLTETTQNEPISIESDFLLKGHTYSWSATVRAASPRSGGSSLTSDSWHFRVAADGEPTTEPAAEPTGEGIFTPMAAPNGCTGVPDRWFKANFKPSCDKHDICYSKGSRTSRKNCDLALLANLTVACVNAYGKIGAVVSGCVDTANSYYIGVRRFGKSHYVGRGSNA